MSDPSTIYFLTQGQFGNNWFQYFAAKILQKIYPSYTSVRPTTLINLEFNHVIDDAKFIQIYELYQQGHTVPLDPQKGVLLMGFFQRSEIFREERDFLKSLFTAENTEYIHNKIPIKNVVQYKTKHTVAPTERDLVLHLRAGDFWDKEKQTSQMFHPEDLKKLIKDLPHEVLYIVRQAPKEKWEEEYFQAFEECQPVWIHGSLGDDFDFLMRAPRIVLSASTMAYMAAFLGNAEEIYLPYNHYYGGETGTGQNLGAFSDSCIVYRDFRTWTPSSQGLIDVSPNKETNV